MATHEDSLRHCVIAKLQKALNEQIYETVDCAAIDSLPNFSQVLMERFEGLVSQLGVRKKLAYEIRGQRFGIASDLERAMDIFGETGRQGCLILDRIDRVMGMQSTIEVEGPLRSVMQPKNTIALILSGSHPTINALVGDSRRPFYLAFRVFRFAMPTLP